MEFFSPEFLSSLLMIVLIDVVLSGDNSIVIALAVRSLPPEKRRMGILAGAGTAAALRIFFTFVAAKLMGVPYLKIIGGLLILWIATKLLSENEDPNPHHKEARSIWHAVWMILVADVTMSLDNVLGVAGASHGDPWLLWFGLGLSIPLVMFASTLLSRLMERFPVIVLLGAAVLGKVGGQMLAEDPAVHPLISHIPYAVNAFEILGIAFIAFWAARLRRKRRRAAV